MSDPIEFEGHNAQWQDGDGLWHNLLNCRCVLTPITQHFDDKKEARVQFEYVGYHAAAVVAHLSEMLEMMTETMDIADVGRIENPFSSN